MGKEIFKIKFDKGKTEEGVPTYMQYTLGATGLVDGELLTPQKITIIKDRVVVLFVEMGITHEFTRTDDVEIYRRDKQDKTEENADI
jgi:hypothetical protein